MKFPPTEGGSYKADAKGNLKQTEKSTEPNPGKAELARRKTKSAKNDAAAPVAKSAAAKKDAPRHG